MKQIYKILEEIKNESSSNKKLEILKKYSDNELLKKVLYYTYNPLINFYVKDYEESNCSDTEDKITSEEIFKVLDKLSERKITGKLAKESLTNVSSKLSNQSSEVLRKIIDRNLRVGIEVKSINKVFPKLIQEVPYMRCKTFKDNKKIIYPCYAQLKEDAAFVNIIFENDEISFKTRNGNEFFPSYLKEEFLHIFHENNIYDDFVITGELMVLEDSKILPREISNGLVNSFIKMEETERKILEEIELKKNNNYSYDKLTSKLIKFNQDWLYTDINMMASVWDIIPLQDWKEGKCKIPYKERFEKLKEIGSSHIRVVETEIVNSLDEAQNFFERMLERGLEGCVLKNFQGEWIDTQSGSYDQVKMKAEKSADLIVVGYKEGVGKYIGGIGSLICATSDGELIVNVAGLTDKERGFERIDINDSSKGLKLIKGFNCEQYNGSIITVTYNSIIDSDDKKTKSLFLPRVNELFRFDKDYADTLKDLERS